MIVSKEVVWDLYFRYLANGRQTIEDNIDWNRLRAPAVDTPAHVLHVSDCLDDLKPGDHIEVQWRRNEDFPYGITSFPSLFFFSSFPAKIIRIKCFQSELLSLNSLLANVIFNLC